MSVTLITLMNYIKIFSFGFLGGVVALFLIFSVPWSGSLVFALIKSNLIGYLGDEPAPTPTPIITSSDFWQKIVSDQALSTVAVQSFSGGKIVREGSGIVVSSDGIILTTFDVVSAADVLQVFYKDKILRVQLVKFNGFKNLALLKSDATNMDVTGFDRNYQFQPGKDVIISGKIVELLNPLVFAQRAIISYILSKEVVLDTEAKYFLSGSKVINNTGAVIGMIYLRSGTTRLIKSETIDDFVKSYFESIK